MDDFPTKIADFLETTATKIRTMTVDRIAQGVRWAAAGVVIGLAGFLLTLFLLVALFRILGELIGVEVTYAVFGGLFVILGVFLLRQRKPRTNKD
ncbi:MAG: hypothetical protein OEM97_07120 [Acidimicrobiia bacterium]|nr:hypothetical protein [Acidimicrobiia bacterium]